MRPSASHYAGGEYYQPHFLDSCSLCQKHLSQNSDIYMYRGNAPFCSQECRQEQIEMDEANEKRWKISSKRSNAVRQSKDSTTESDTDKAVRTGTVAVA
ncbi:FCS-Like Zinc finger 3-like [Salvia divinorum]|uniref:FCS-Like Zinc finger 3-like n=1 Tax=Salvia divinorum TaxID=28513 RepID=A0ABD1G7J7_SALDI